MRIFTYSQARQRLSDVLEIARREEVRIRRRSGECFSVRRQEPAASPFDVPSIPTRASTRDILAAVAESRAH